MYDYYNVESTNLVEFSTVLVSGVPSWSTSSVTLGEMKTHLRLVSGLDEEWVNASSEDDYIKQCISAASQSIANFMRMPLMLSKYRVTLQLYDTSVSKFLLPIPCVRSITNVKGISSDFSTVDVTPTNITYLDEFVNVSLPLNNDLTAYVVEFTCGYDSQLQMPYDIKQMIMTLATQMYEHRGDMFMRAALDWPFYHLMVPLVRYPEHFYQSGLMLNTKVILPTKEVY